MVWTVKLSKFVSPSAVYNVSLTILPFSVPCKYKTPSNAVLVHCVWAAVILLVRGQFETIASGMVFAVLIFYALNTLALFKLRKESDKTMAFKIPFYPWLPAIYLAGIIILTIFRVIYEWEKSLVDLAFIATGIPFLIIWRKKQKHRLERVKK